jgi:hypothetical protein
MENPETHATYAITNTFAVTLSASVIKIKYSIKN